MARAITLNCVWSGVALSAGSNLLSFFIAALNLAELISVSPHVTDSSIASWRKMYWSYTNENNNTQLVTLLCTAYRCLDHFHALVPHLVDCSCNVHHFLFLDLLQHTVDTDEGTSASNTSTACMHILMCTIYYAIIFMGTSLYLWKFHRKPVAPPSFI